MRSSTQLLSDSVAVFKNNFLIFGKLWLLPLVANIILGVLFSHPEKTPSIIVVLCMVAISMLYTIATVRVMSTEGSVAPKDAYLFAKENFLSYLWISIIGGIIAIVGFIAFIIPGIIVSVFMVFAIFILLVEGKKGADALRASRDYVRGKWWSVFGRLMFLVVLTIIYTVLLSTIFGINDSNTNDPFKILLSQIINFPVVVISLAYVYFMYLDVKNQVTPQASVPTQTTPQVTE